MRDATRDDLEAAKDREEADKSGEKVEKEKKAAKPWVIDRLQFKSDEVGYLDHRRTHLYVFDMASKKSTQVTSGDFDDVGAAWSPDGTKLAFASNRTADPDRNYDENIWVVAADNTDKGANADADHDESGRGSFAGVVAGWEVDRVCDADRAEVV